MRRLCGRPGCSDAASVTYGMRPEDLVFWIDALPDPVDDAAAVLCRRHADAMVVPRGWTLDDLRDPDLHLFRPPLPAPVARQRVPRQRRGPTAGEQLELSVQSDPQLDGGASAQGGAAEGTTPTPLRGRRRSTRRTTSTGSSRRAARCSRGRSAPPTAPPSDTDGALRPCRSNETPSCRARRNGPSRSSTICPRTPRGWIWSTRCRRSRPPAT
jgi:hypothetical protein